MPKQTLIFEPFDMAKLRESRHAADLEDFRVVLAAGYTLLQRGIEVGDHSIPDVTQHMAAILVDFAAFALGSMFEDESLSPAIDVESFVSLVRERLEFYLQPEAPNEIHYPQGTA